MAQWSHDGVGRVMVVLGWAAVVATPFASHVAITTGRFTGPAIVLALVQAGVLLAASLRQRLVWQRRLGVFAALGLLLLLVVRLPLGEARAGLVASAGLSHSVIYASLLVIFAQSLRPGRIAVVTAVAARFREVLDPRIRAYTRIVTKAWCVFFASQLCFSAALAAFAPASVWSLFVNVLDAPLVVTAFLAEFAIRRWRFRDGRHTSPLAVARAFARDRASG